MSVLFYFILFFSLLISRSTPTLAVSSSDLMGSHLCNDKCSQKIPAFRGECPPERRPITMHQLPRIPALPSLSLFFFFLFPYPYL